MNGDPRECQHVSTAEKAMPLSNTETLAALKRMDPGDLTAPVPVDLSRLGGGAHEFPA
jgi:hypothetical protein